MTLEEKVKDWVFSNVVLAEYTDIEYADLIDSLVLFILKEQEIENDPNN